MNATADVVIRPRCLTCNALLAEQVGPKTRILCRKCRTVNEW